MVLLLLGILGVMMTYEVGILTSHVVEEIVNETVEFYNWFK